MAKYRKKPVVIEAVQWNKLNDAPDVRMATAWDIDTFNLLPRMLDGEGPFGVIETLEGPHIVTPGDWIITGVKGEQYPCKPDIFEATYELVE